MPDFASLKARHRATRGGLPEPFNLRVHRALSWLGRAEQAGDDPDVAFILLWIGFNAAYAAHVPDDGSSERDRFAGFFRLLVRLDSGHRLYGLVWTRFSQEIRLLLDNRFVFQPFWRHHNGEPGFSDWANHLAASRRRIASALRNRDTASVLEILFDRLYVLRNQLIHGGATWAGSANRAQVRDGTAILARMLPVMIELMLDNPEVDWGRPHYPLITDGST